MNAPRHLKTDFERVQSIRLLLHLKISNEKVDVKKFYEKNFRFTKIRFDQIFEKTIFISLNKYV